MQIVYSDQGFPTYIEKSIFLAGPSPRDWIVADWRPEALKHLEDLGFDGTVFVPIPKDRFEKSNFQSSGNWSSTWRPEDQIGWEVKARAASDLLVFWCARSVAGKMPGFTTNIEFGEDLHSARILYGRPDGADHTRYMDIRYRELKEPIYNDLKSLLARACELLKDPIIREGVEVQIPRQVFTHPAFETWYQDLKVSGHELQELQVLAINAKSLDSPAFSVVIKPKIWVPSENRYKENEQVYLRLNSCACIPWFKKDDGTIEVVLVKEKRQSVSNAEGFVYEWAGGSSWADPKMQNLQEVMLGELQEELGLKIQDPKRLMKVSTRQVMATLLGHKQTVFTLKLTRTQWEELTRKAHNKDILGADPGERIQIIIVPVKEVHKLPVDYAVLGALWEAQEALRG